MIAFANISLISRSLGSIASCPCGVRSASPCTHPTWPMSQPVSTTVCTKTDVGLSHLLTFYRAGGGGKRGRHRLQCNGEEYRAVGLPQYRLMLCACAQARIKFFGGRRTTGTCRTSALSDRPFGRQPSR
jgi:hypothetical protein